MKEADRGSDTPLADRVAEWIAEVNSRDKGDQPIRWVDGAYHCAAGIAHVWNDEHEDELTGRQIGGALTAIRDNPEEYDVEVEYRRSGTPPRGRWQVYKGVFANVGA